MYFSFFQRYSTGLRIVLTCSILLNILTFAGSLYMMLVYDSVLPSRSVPTLVGLFVMLIAIYAFQVLFEAIRGEAMLGVANRLRADFRPAVQDALTRRALAGRSEGDGMQAVRDLDQVHAYAAGAGPLALIDLPWVIVFLIVLTALHWALGLTALIGALVLAGLTALSTRGVEAGTNALSQVTGLRSAATLAQLRQAESARAMGMETRLRQRSAWWDDEYVRVQTALSRTVARFGGPSRAFRIFLQSVILTVGALLVIEDKASGGVILASSVLAGRALAPVDQAIANWRGLTAARAGLRRLLDAYAQARPQGTRSVTLAPPSGEIAVRDLWLVPPSAPAPVLGGVSFSLQPGDALAVIGPSGSGKTSLAKALLGIWPATRGEVRIGGATLDQWHEEVLGASLGYVAQTVELIDGTIAENIARLDPMATSDRIIAAASAAGLHEFILALPDGYETAVTATGAELSAGQRQRLGLARALYGDPYLVVLDEANSNLDAAGDAALAAAIEGVKARKGVVVMITHN